MKKIIFQIANYPDIRQEIFNNHYMPITKQFANKHGYEYLLYNEICTYRNCSWQKIFKVNELITSNFLKNDDVVLFLDADTCIIDLESDYPTNKNFNYSIDNGNTHCMGIWSMKICDWTKQLINNFMNEDLYEACKHQELWYQFSEQGAWYTLAGIPRHNWVSFLNSDDYGWNKTQDEFYKTKIKYSVSELKENVSVMGPEWNATILEEEYNIPGIAVYENYTTYPDYLKKYNIVKSKKENTKIRHFAGGQPWRIP
jgi:hypothetical protein